MAGSASGERGAVNGACDSQPPTALLDTPTALTLVPGAGGSSTLYVADYGNHVVRAVQLTPSGTCAGISTYAGKVVSSVGRFAAEGYLQDLPGKLGDGGLATSALLYKILGLAWSGGTLYISDAGHYLIRAVTWSASLGGNVISTFFGVPHTKLFLADLPKTASYYDANGAAVSCSTPPCTKPVSLDWEPPERHLWAPRGITVSPSGGLLLVVDDNHVRAISIRDPSKVRVVAGVANFSQPSHLDLPKWVGIPVERPVGTTLTEEEVTLYTYASILNCYDYSTCGASTLYSSFESESCYGLSLSLYDNAPTFWPYWGDGALVCGQQAYSYTYHGSFRTSNCNLGTENKARLHYGMRSFCRAASVGSQNYYTALFFDSPVLLAGGSSYYDSSRTSLTGFTAWTPMVGTATERILATFQCTQYASLWENLGDLIARLSSIELPDWDRCTRRRWICPQTGEVFVSAGSYCSMPTIDNGDGRAATSAYLYRPSGLAVSGSRLYISEPEANLVRVVDLDTGLINTFAGESFHNCTA